MPPTRLIVWERGRSLATNATRSLDPASATVASVDDEVDFRDALAEAAFPVVVLDRRTVGAKLVDAIAAATMSAAWIVVVGAASPDARRRDRDLGAHLLVDALPDRLIWGGTLKRFIRASQQRMKQAYLAPKT